MVQQRCHSPACGWLDLGSPTAIMCVPSCADVQRHDIFECFSQGSSQNRLCKRCTSEMEHFRSATTVFTSLTAPAMVSEVRQRYTTRLSCPDTPIEGYLAGAVRWGHGRAACLNASSAGKVAIRCQAPAGGFRIGSHPWQTCCLHEHSDRVWKLQPKRCQGGAHCESDEFRAAGVSDSSTCDAGFEDPSFTSKVRSKMAIVERSLYLTKACVAG